MMNLYLLTNEEYRTDKYLDAMQADVDDQWAGFLIAADSVGEARKLATAYVYRWCEGRLDTSEGWSVKLIGTSRRKRPGVIRAV